RSESSLVRLLQGFVHRTYTGRDVAHVLFRAARIQRELGGLGLAFQAHMESTSGDLRESLARFADELRGASNSRSLLHFVSDPRPGSSRKRLLLYLRWMIRPADGVDLGIWPLSPSVLLIPVDTHVHRIARNLGLTARKNASWRTAEEITRVLRTFDPE